MMTEEECAEMNGVSAGYDGGYNSYMFLKSTNEAHDVMSLERKDYTVDELLQFANNISNLCRFDNNLTLIGDVVAGNNTSPDHGDKANDYQDAMYMQKILSIVVPILFGIIVLVGLIGNALVVIVVVFNPQMRSTTNLLIINLAIADLLFIVFCVPFTAFDYAASYWPFGDVWCRMVQYLIVVCAYASIYTLVLMSLDRYLAVAHPIQSMSIRTEKNAYLAISILWMAILLACIPSLIYHGELRYIFAHLQYSVCIFLVEQYNQAMYQVIFFLTSYVIPITIILILYMLMLKRLWLGVAPGGHTSVESVRSKKRVTRMVVVVVIIFAVCWCPIQVVLVLKSFNQYDVHNHPIKLVFQIASHILAYMNSCVNPILYAFLSENFRKAFHKVIACNSRESNVQVTRRRRTLDERTERETTFGSCVNTKTTKIINGNV